MSSADSVVQTIGFNPCPNSAFVTVAPDVKSLDVIVPVLGDFECLFARVVYALWVLRVCEEHDNRQDLIAAFRRSWPCDVQSVDVARVDGLDDLSRGGGTGRENRTKRRKNV